MCIIMSDFCNDIFGLSHEELAFQFRLLQLLLLLFAL